MSYKVVQFLPNSPCECIYTYQGHIDGGLLSVKGTSKYFWCHQFEFDYSADHVDF